MCDLGVMVVELLALFFIQEAPSLGEALAVVVLIVLVGAEKHGVVFESEKGNLAAVALELLLGVAPLLIQEELLLGENVPAVFGVLADD